MHLPPVPKLCKGDTSKYGNSCETREAEPDTMLTLTPISKKYLSKVTLFASCLFPFHLISLERVDKEKKRWGKKEPPWEDREKNLSTSRSEEFCPLKMTCTGDKGMSL